MFALLALALASSPPELLNMVCGPVDPTYVRRAGDTMNGTLRFTGTSTRGKLKLASPTTTSSGICWDPTCSIETYWSGGAINFTGQSTIAIGSGVLSIRNASASWLDIGTAGNGFMALSPTSFNLDIVPTIYGQTLPQFGYSTPDFRGSSWWENLGQTAAALEAKTPTAGSGGLIYDDTNTCWRSYQNGAWQTGCIAVAGKTPIVWTGTSPTAVQAVRDVAYTSMGAATVGVVMSYLPMVVGVGAGNVTVGLHDGTSYICSGTCSCTTAVGTACSAAGACAGTALPTGNTRLRIDTSACGTGPIASLTLQYRPQ